MIRFLIFILLSSSIILHADKVNINNINVNLPKVKGYYLFSASNHPEILEAFNMVYASFGQCYGLYVKEESSWKLLSGNTLIIMLQLEYQMDLTKLSLARKEQRFFSRI